MYDKRPETCSIQHYFHGIAKKYNYLIERRTFQMTRLFFYKYSICQTATHNLPYYNKISTFVFYKNKYTQHTMRKRFFTFILLIVNLFILRAQHIPQHISYTQIYDYIDELAADGFIQVNSVVRPYTRDFIAEKLLEAQAHTDKMSKRQKADLRFYLNDYAIERDTLPKTYVHWTDKKSFDLSLVQPAFHYTDSNFKCRIVPLLGMDIIANQKGAVVKRWYGADLQMDIVNHVSVYANLRDNSFNGSWFLSDKYFPTATDKMYGARLSQPLYLNNLPGCEYKEASYGGDYSDMRGGIVAYCKWGSIGLIKDNIIWGDSYNCSNILSGRAPSFPMITLNIKPVKWFEVNYIHGWLVSNVLDSTNYYLENVGTDTEKKHYRPHNKFIAANMLTFTPIPKLDLSVGNAIIYAEQNVQPAYFIPIAFYKSIDHFLTKGTKTENQNSQLFINISSRNIPHLHLFASAFVDEIKFARFKPSNPQTNPISYKAGFNLTNWPLKNLSLVAEYTRSNIICYKHSIETLSWKSSSYILGHYLGDNAQEIFVSLRYRPIRSLYFDLSYTNAQKGNDYDYLRSNIIEIISQKTMQDIVWKQDLVSFDAIYEIFNNCYAKINISYNHARSSQPSSEPIEGEVRLTAQEYLDRYTPVFYQGKNITFTCGLNFGF